MADAITWIEKIIQILKLKYFFINSTLPDMSLTNFKLQVQLSHVRCISLLLGILNLKPEIYQSNVMYGNFMTQNSTIKCVF